MSNQYPLPPVNVAAQPVVLVDANGNPLVSSSNPLAVSQIVSGAPISATNPEINIANFQAMTLSGQAFNASTGKIAAAANMAGEVFFPNTNPKNILIWSIRMTYTNANQPASFQAITALDSAIGGAGVANMTIENLLMGGSGSASGLTANYNGGIASPTGTALDLVNIQNSTTQEFLSNQTFVYIPKSTAGGIAAYIPTTAAGSWSMTVRWVEF